MKRFIVPLLMLVLGVGGGIGAGLYIMPAPPKDTLVESNPLEVPPTDPGHTAVAPEPGEEREYAKLNNQFIVPVVSDGHVKAMVVLALNVEVVAGGRTAVFAAEPKLRDAFLQAMFDHANNGGFSGNFTSGDKTRALRNDLLRRARLILGAQVTDVLITDFVRQDS